MTKTENFKTFGLGDSSKDCFLKGKKVTVTYEVRVVLEEFRVV